MLFTGRQYFLGNEWESTEAERGPSSLKLLSKGDRGSNVPLPRETNIIYSKALK